MGNSFAQESDFVCPACEKHFRAAVWLIVDADERPDLVKQVAADRLHALGCPRCYQAGAVDAPLLLYRPGQEPLLVFSPAQNTDDEQRAEHAGNLLGLLSETLGPLWHDTWLDQVVMVPRADLALQLAGTESPRAAGAAALRGLQAGDPASYQRLLADVHQVTAEMIEADPFLAGIQALSTADSMADYLRVAYHYPGLLTTDGATRIAAGLAAAHQQGDDTLAEILLARYEHLVELTQIVAESEVTLEQAIEMAEEG